MVEDIDIQHAEAYDRSIVNGINQKYPTQKARPWSTQNKLLALEPLTIDKTIEIITDCAKVNIRNAGFLALLYVTGARIGEIIGSYKKEDKNILGERKYKGLRVGSLYTVEEQDGSYFLCIHLEVEKKKGKIVFRDAFLHENVPYDKALIGVIDSFMEQLFSKEKNNPEKKLFEFSHTTAWKTVKRYFHVNPHWLRALRTTHLSENYGFSTRELQDYIKWDDPDMATRYSKSSEKKIKSKLKNLM